MSVSNDSPTRTSIDSIDSEIGLQRITQLPEQIINPTLPTRILTRASAIISAVRDDNKYVSEVQSRVPRVSLENYDGQFNKDDILDRPPDGTFWGWVSAGCVCTLNTFSWGANASFGVFLNYYTSTNHFPGATMEDYALIGGFGLGLSFIFCLVTTVLVRRFYYKYIMAAGAVLITICYITAAEATTITQLIMLQGFLLSIGYALTAAPGFIIIPSWFLEKRTIALGIGTSGGGLAGIIFSKPIQILVDSTGNYKWALRMIGIVCGVMLTVTILLIRCRKKFEVKSEKSFFQEVIGVCTRWDIYGQTPILCIAAYNFFYGIGYAIVLFTLSSYARAVGMTYSQGSIVTIVQSVAQTVGRPLLGFLCDTLGKANVTIVASLLIALFTSVWWIFIRQYANLIVFAFISGLILGANWVTFSPLCADVVGAGDDLLAAVSFIYITGGVPMIVGEMIGLKLERSGENKPFLYCQILVCAVSIVAAIFLTGFREWKVRRMLEARRVIIEKDEHTSEENKLRLERYGLLLKSGIKGYLMRSIYPIKA